jgi:hypothetical protein
VPASAEEDPYAEVKARLFNCYCRVDLHTDCITARRKPSPGGPSKATEQQPTIEQATSHVATASAPPPMGGTCLMVCSNAEARHSIQLVLHHLESLKDVDTERKGTQSSFVASNI